MNSKRSYTMTTRARGVEDTRRRILEATFALSETRLLSELSLDAVARAAGVSVQTVLRQFGSRAARFEATSEHAARLVAEERRVPAGDVPAAVRVLVDHYEERGDATLMLLAQERSEEAVAPIVQRAR